MSQIERFSFLCSFAFFSVGHSVWLPFLKNSEQHLILARLLLLIKSTFSYYILKRNICIRYSHQYNLPGLIMCISGTIYLTEKEALWIKKSPHLSQKPIFLLYNICGKSVGLYKEGCKAVNLCSCGDRTNWYVEKELHHFCIQIQAHWRC